MGGSDRLTGVDKLKYLGKSVLREITNVKEAWEAEKREICRKVTTARQREMDELREEIKANEDAKAIHNAYHKLIRKMMMCIPIPRGEQNPLDDNLSLRFELMQMWTKFQQ